MSSTTNHFALFSHQFADGEYQFCLDVPKAIEFEKKFDKSLFATMNGMMAGRWFVEDIGEIIRLALIGGGASPSEAYRLVKAYVDLRPIDENTALAFKVLNAFFFGADDKPAEPEAEAAAA